MSVSIDRTIDGYECQFEGREYEGDDPSVGLVGGYTYWDMVSATRADGSELSDVELRYITDDLVENRPWESDDILVALNVAHDEQDDSDLDDVLHDWDQS